MLVLWQSLLASLNSYLMVAKKKEKLRKLNSSLKSSNASLSRMRSLPASLTSIATVALLPIPLTSWLIMYNLFFRVISLVATKTLVKWAQTTQVRRHLQAYILRTVPSSQEHMSVSISRSTLGRKWSLSRILVQSIVVLRPKVVKDKLRLLKEKLSLHFRSWKGSWRSHVIHFWRCKHQQLPQLLILQNQPQRLLWAVLELKWLCTMTHRALWQLDWGNF